MVPGPTGPQGVKGDTGATGATGPAGPSTGPAGGALAGTYPNPSLSSPVNVAAVTTDTLGGRASDLMLSSNVNANGKVIWGVADPTSADWVANKKYVDQVTAALAGRLGPAAQSVSFVTDWNNATANGWYYGGVATNGPVPAGHYIAQVIASNTDNLVQIATEYLASTSANTATFMRNKAGAAWGAWYKVQWSQVEQDARYMRSTLGGAEMWTTIGTSGTQTLNLATATIFLCNAPTGNITLSPTNIPALAATIQIDFYCGSFVPTITYPAGTAHAGGTAVAAVANKTLSVQMQYVGGFWKAAGTVFG